MYIIDTLYPRIKEAYIYNRAFHEVIDALLILYQSNVTLPSSDALQIPLSQIANSFKYSPYFDDCLGALDGTYVEMYIPIELQPRYRNQKGTLS